MSISSEINRISQNVSDSLTAVAAKGVTVPSGANSDDLPTLIASIQTGGGGTPAISVVDTTDSHGGTVREITALDISDTTAIASVVQSPYWFYTAEGVKTQGTASGGGAPSATQHTIYFEFSDSTNTTITAYWDDSFISNAITATEPTTYGGKTVTLAQLDGVTWYEVSSGIPLNTELVDYSAVTTNRNVDEDGTITTGESWDCVTDYIPIDPSMTFTFICRAWYNIGFYNSSKSPVRVVASNDIAGSTVSNDYTHGTLTPSVIPSNAAYVVLSGNSYALNSNYLSLIRTA